MDLVVFIGAMVGLAGAMAIGYLCGKRGEPVRDWVQTRRARRRDRHLPTARPIETVVAEVRRLGIRFHGLHPHASYAKVQAVTSAYYRALSECCASLGFTHLLGVLPPGPELDAERERVETVLDEAGVDLPYVF